MNHDVQFVWYLLPAAALPAELGSFPSACVPTCSVFQLSGWQYALSWCQGTLPASWRGVLARRFQLGWPPTSGPWGQVGRRAGIQQQQLMVVQNVSCQRT